MVVSETINSVVTVATLLSPSCFPSEGGEALHEVEWQKGLTAVAQSQEIREWFVVHVVSRHEKRVAEHFHTRQIDHFLPLYQTPRAWRDGSKGAVRLPLFPGYVFVHLALCDRLQELQTPSVVRLVGFGGQPAALPDQEIEALRQGLTHEMYIEPYPYLKVGHRVRVRTGPLRGLEGILVRKKNGPRFVISLDLIMRSVAAEIDVAELEPVR